MKLQQKGWHFLPGMVAEVEETEPVVMVTQVRREFVLFVHNIDQMTF